MLLYTDTKTRTQCLVALLEQSASDMKCHYFPRIPLGGNNESLGFQEQIKFPLFKGHEPECIWLFPLLCLAQVTEVRLGSLSGSVGSANGAVCLSAAIIDHELCSFASVDKYIHFTASAQQQLSSEVRVYANFVNMNIFNRKSNCNISWLCIGIFLLNTITMKSDNNCCHNNTIASSFYI